MSSNPGRSVAIRAFVFLLLLTVLAWAGIGFYRQWRAAKELEAQTDAIAADARRQIPPPSHISYNVARAWLEHHGYGVVTWNKDDPAKGWIGSQDNKGTKIHVVAGQRPLTKKSELGGDFFVYLAFQFDDKDHFTQLGAWPQMQPLTTVPPATSQPKSAPSTSP